MRRPLIALSLAVASLAVAMPASAGTTFADSDLIPNRTRCAFDAGAGRYQVMAKGTGTTLMLPSGPDGATYYVAARLTIERQTGDGEWVLVERKSRRSTAFTSVPPEGVTVTARIAAINTKRAPHRATLTTKLRRKVDGPDPTVASDVDQNSFICTG